MAAALSGKEVVPMHFSFGELVGFASLVVAIIAVTQKKK